MKYKKHQSVFKQHMFIYIIFSWIIILLFMGILYFNMTSRLNEKWSIQQENTLGMLEYLIDFQVQRMDDVIREVRVAEEIRNLQLENQVVEVMELQGELKRLKRLCPIVEEIIVHIEGNKYIYSSETTYTAETLKLIRGLSTNQIKTDNKVGDLKLLMVRGNEKIEKERRMVLNHPFIIAGNKNIGSITLIINDKELHKMIGSMLLDDENQFIILQRNNMIWGRHLIEEQDLFQIQAIVSKFMKSEEVIELGNKQYQMFYNSSPTTKLQYVLCVDKNQEIAQLEYVQWGFIMMTIFMMSISGVAVYLLMSRTYRPLKVINKLLSDIPAEGMEEKNEFEKIEAVITRLTDENKSLDDQLERLVEQQQNYLYYKLLKGKYDREIEEIIGQLGKNYKGCYRVLVYRMYGEVDTIKKEQLSRVLKTIFGTDIVHIEVGMEMQQISCIINNSEKSNTQIQEAIEKVQKFFVKKEEDILVGVGRTYYDWREITKSFQDAKLALEHREISKRGQVIWYETIDKKECMNHVSGRIMVKLKLDINKEDLSAVKEDLEIIKVDIRQRGSTYKETKEICSRLLGEIIASVELRQREYLLNGDMLPTEEEMIQVDSIDRLDFIVDKIANALGDMIEWNTQNQKSLVDEKSSLYMQMMRYMKENYANYDLSIQEIADKNNIALPNLTTYFKKQVGQTPKDYLTHIRMKRAKELLITTTEGLNQIANQVGYQNTSSFIRQFKKMEGMTPGEYRKIK